MFCFFPPIFHFLGSDSAGSLQWPRAEALRRCRAAVVAVVAPGLGCTRWGAAEVTPPLGWGAEQLQPGWAAFSVLTSCRCRYLARHLRHLLRSHQFSCSRPILPNWCAVISEQGKGSAAARLRLPQVSSAGGENASLSSYSSKVTFMLLFTSGVQGGVSAVWSACRWNQPGSPVVDSCGSVPWLLCVSEALPALRALSMGYLQVRSAQITELCSVPSVQIQTKNISRKLLAEIHWKHWQQAGCWGLVAPLCRAQGCPLVDLFLRAWLRGDCQRWKHCWEQPWDLLAPLPFVLGSDIQEWCFCLYNSVAVWCVSSHWCTAQLRSPCGRDKSCAVQGAQKHYSMQILNCQVCIIKNLVCAVPCPSLLTSSAVFLWSCIWGAVCSL